MLARLFLSISFGHSLSLNHPNLHVQESLAGYGAPLSVKDRVALERTGLRTKLQNMLSGTSNISVLFVGDSLMRNQYQGLCHLLGAKEIGGAYDFLQTCKTPQISAYMSWSAGEGIQDLPDKLHQLQKKGVREPSIIYWDGLAHHQNNSHGKSKLFFEDHAYADLITRTEQSFAKLAPHSKIAFFLSHAICKNRPLGKVFMTSEGVSKLNDLAQSALQSQKDGQGRDIQFVDGFNLVADKCDQKYTQDGEHFNPLVWDELIMLLKEIV